MWDGIQEVATAGGGGGVESAMSRSEAVTGTANQVGGAAKSVMVRPVWLALAGGKLFLREKVRVLETENLVRVAFCIHAPSPFRHVGGLVVWWFGARVLTGLISIFLFFVILRFFVFF